MATGPRILLLHGVSKPDREHALGQTILERAFLSRQSESKLS